MGPYRKLQHNRDTKSSWWKTRRRAIACPSDKQSYQSMRHLTSTSLALVVHVLVSIGVLMALPILRRQHGT